MKILVNITNKAGFTLASEVVEFTDLDAKIIGVDIDFSKIIIPEFKNPLTAHCSICDKSVEIKTGGEIINTKDFLGFVCNDCLKLKGETK